MKNITVSEILFATKGTLISGNESLEITDVSIDSKNIPNNKTLFIPLKGERVDAHQYIGSAIENGAMGCLATDLSLVPDGAGVVIMVDNTQEALQNIGTFYRKTRDIKLVGVTGSVGKTTTRELTSAALFAIGHENVFQTRGNRNSQTGVPLTLCDIVDEKLGVIELGISEAGEMEILSQMAKPDVAIITTIGVAHIQQLKSQENICYEKLSIVKGMNPEGVVILNGDDPFQRNYRSRLAHKSLLYGTSDDCDYIAKDIRQNASGMCFKLLIGAEKAEFDIYIPVMGIHNVLNATAALAAAHVLGVNMEAAVESIAGFGGVKMRQQILEVNGFTIIDDSYNANPDSMKAGLRVLSDYKLSGEGRKIALLADMKELGDDEIKYHEEVGVFAAKLPINKLLLVGKLAAKIGEAYQNEKQATADGEILCFENNSEASEYLNNFLHANDILYVKGSRSMALDEVIAALK